MRTIRRLLLGIFAGGLLTISMQAYAITPEPVIGVEQCGPNNVSIYLANGTVLYFTLLDQVNMTQNLYDHLYAMALELLASGKALYWYNNLGTATICGNAGAIEVNDIYAQ